MIHARSDYDRIQDPAVSDPSLLSEGSTPIGDDEPVFLIRASDQAFADAVAAWMVAHINADGDPKVAMSVAKHLGNAITWQEKNRRELADAPHSVLK